MALDTFPQGFMWGAATAAYQIEGAAREDGRGESIWDRFSHTPGKTLSGESGDIADDHYHRYADDIGLMNQLGLKAYRFSIAWPRLFPDGKGKVNTAGLDFYSRLVDRLGAAGITPFATLYHWDLPQALEDAGGWPNPDTAHRFADYAAAAFDVLGDRIQHWITLNEPWCSAFLGYYDGHHAPGRTNLDDCLAAGHTLLLAHGLAVQRYRATAAPHGRIGLVDNFSSYHPATDSDEDRAAARRGEAQMNRWFLDPIYRGDYPEEMRAAFGNRMPRFTDEQRTIVTTPIDFIGVNYYSRDVVASDPSNPWMQTRRVRPAGGEYTAMDWEVYPRGLYEVLTWLRDQYGSPSLYVTENGAAFNDVVTSDGAVHDDARRRYLLEHFRSAHRAITDGVRLAGYFVWSLMDNFEWAFGYSKRFGITYVDYATQRRIPKDSAHWYAQVIRQNAVGDS